MKGLGPLLYLPLPHEVCVDADVAQNALFHKIKSAKLRTHSSSTPRERLEGEISLT